MARPLKTGLDYFPMNVNFDDEFKALEELHGNDGFVWLIKFWQSAYKTNDGVVDLNGIRGIIAAKTSRISIEKQGDIIRDCLILGLLKEISSGIYTSNGLQRRINNIVGDREYDRNYQKNKLSERKPTDNSPITGESKVNKIKVNKIKENKETPVMAFDLALNDFVEMRKKSRKPFTDRAKELILKKLNGLATTEAEKILILEQSIVNGWLGVFPLKKDWASKKDMRGEGEQQLWADYVAQEFKKILADSEWLKAQTRNWPMIVISKTIESSCVFWQTDKGKEFCGNKRDYNWRAALRNYFNDKRFDDQKTFRAAPWVDPDEKKPVVPEVKMVDISGLMEETFRSARKAGTIPEIDMPGPRG